MVALVCGVWMLTSALRVYRANGVCRFSCNLNSTWLKTWSSAIQNAAYSIDFRQGTLRTRRVTRTFGLFRIPRRLLVVGCYMYKRFVWCARMLEHIYYVVGVCIKFDPIQRGAYAGCVGASCACKDGLESIIPNVSAEYVYANSHLRSTKYNNHLAVAHLLEQHTRIPPQLYVVNNCRPHIYIYSLFLCIYNNGLRYRSYCVCIALGEI